MTINGKRRFRHNGKSYYVADAIGKDREKGKYYLQQISTTGITRLVRTQLYDLAFFKTIKDAQRAIFFNSDWYIAD